MYRKSAVSSCVSSVKPVGRAIGSIFPLLSIFHSRYFLKKLDKFLSFKKSGYTYTCLESTAFGFTQHKSNGNFLLSSQKLLIFLHKAGIILNAKDTAVFFTTFWVWGQTLSPCNLPLTLMLKSYKQKLELHTWNQNCMISNQIKWTRLRVFSYKKPDIIWETSFLSSLTWGS